MFKLQGLLLQAASKNPQKETSRTHKAEHSEHYTMLQVSHGIAEYGQKKCRCACIANCSFALAIVPDMSAAAYDIKLLSRWNVQAAEPDQAIKNAMLQVNSDRPYQGQRFCG